MPFLPRLFDFTPAMLTLMATEFHIDKKRRRVDKNSDDNMAKIAVIPDLNQRLPQQISARINQKQLKSGLIVKGKLCNQIINNIDKLKDGESLEVITS